MTQPNLPHNHGQHTQRVLEQFPDTQDFELSAELFRQLSDTTRLRLFWLLCHCEECVINLSAIMEMSSPAISHHLKLLKSAGLITSRREGKEVYYTVANNVKAQALHHSLERILSISCPN